MDFQGISHRLHIAPLEVPFHTVGRTSGPFGAADVRLGHGRTPAGPENPSSPAPIFKNVSERLPDAARRSFQLPYGRPHATPATAGGGSVGGD